MPLSARLARPLRRSACTVLASLLGACGPSPGGAPAADAPTVVPDRSSPQVVLVQAHRALAAGDLSRLAPLLTEEGRDRLERDLRAWHTALLDPVTGPAAAARVPAPEDPAERASARRALAEGDPAGLLRLLVRAEPREPLPPQPPQALAPEADRVETSYPARHGERRRVVLVRGPDGWRIDRLQL